MGQCGFYKCKVKEKKKLDIISDNASFANALSNVEPHQHLGGDKSISQGILYKKTKQKQIIIYIYFSSF